MLNSTNWIGIDIAVDGQPLDLASCKVTDFTRVLNMKEGTLSRAFTAEFEGGKKIRVDAIRFVSMARQEIGAIRYAVTPLNFDGILTVTPYLDGDVQNRDANYDEKFWVDVAKEFGERDAALTVKTKKLDFHLTSVMAFEVAKNGEAVKLETEQVEKEKYVGFRAQIEAAANEQVVVYKYAANVTSRDHGLGQLIEAGRAALRSALEAGFETLYREQVQAWADKWRDSDIVIEGDVAAQQAIRFNIFQLNQTYTGEDDRLNIGPKGFYRRKIRRQHILGHRSLLPAVLLEHRRQLHRPQPAHLPLQAFGKGEGKRAQARLRERRPVSDGDDERRRMP